MVDRAAWSAGLVRAILAAWLLTACTSSHELLTVFFDGVPPAGEATPWVPVVKPPRRLPYKPPEPLVKRIEIPDLPPPIDWRGRYQALAKNDAGEVAWLRALNDKAIAPKPGIADDAKEDEVTDLELEFVPKDKPEYKVVFAHKPHTQWLGCGNCHSGIFEMEKGKAAMSMDKLNEGAYCGACHGKVASPDLANCAGCHKTM